MEGDTDGRDGGSNVLGVGGAKKAGSMAGGAQKAGSKVAGNGNAGSKMVDRKESELLWKLLQVASASARALETCSRNFGGNRYAGVLHTSHNSHESYKTTAASSGGFEVVAEVTGVASMVVDVDDDVVGG